LIHRESYAEFNLDQVQVTSVRQRRRFSSAENKLRGLSPLLLTLRRCASVQVHLGTKVYLHKTPVSSLKVGPPKGPGEKLPLVVVVTQPDGKVLQTEGAGGGKAIRTAGNT
jgi:hypothetical protein